jgi:hypothetical protein
MGTWEPGMRVLMLHIQMCRSWQKASALWNNTGIRGEFRVNDHPYWFGLVISAGENNMVRWCERFEFDASTAFWTGHSKRKREPKCPMRPNFQGPWMVRPSAPECVAVPL